MCYELIGNWKDGRAYALHTLSSNYLGVDQNGYKHWDNTYSEMGELVHQLKYNNQVSNVPLIVDLLVDKFDGLDTLDCIIPAPASKVRQIQPVHAIASALAQKVGIAYEDVLSKQSNVQLKEIDDYAERLAILRQSMKLKPGKNLQHKNVLIVDDLFRSGATLQVATEILYRDAKCHNVYVLTMTKTRSKR